MGNNSKSKITPDKYINGDKKFVLGIIDVQNDFCKGGALAVNDANSIIARINKLRFICYDYMKTFISQDYHPENHMSFASTHDAEEFSKKQLILKMEDNTTIKVEQNMWPSHCVQNMPGSNFHPDLIVLNKDKIIQKGTKENVESYSAFGDEFKGKYEKTELNEWLIKYKITDIVLVGIATDYCVYHTALDALRLGFKVHIILSCVKGVDPGTTYNSLEDLKYRGVKMYDLVDDFYEEHKNSILSDNKKY